MKRADFDLLIAARADGAGNLVAPERNLWTKLADETFPNVSIEEVSSGTGQLVTTPISNTNQPYQLNFTKNGSLIYLHGWIANNRSIQSNIVICTINDLISGIPNDFLPDVTPDTTTGLPPVFRATATDINTENTCRVILLRDDIAGNSKLRISGYIEGAFITGFGNKYYFSMQYLRKKS